MKAFAQVTIPDPASVLPGWKISSLGQVVSEFLRYALVFGGLAMFVFLIMGGFKLLTSAGDSAKVKEGTDNISLAVIGFFVIFAAYWLIQIVGFVFDLPV